MSYYPQLVLNLDLYFAKVWDFFKKELALYPGRLFTISRMVVAASLVTLVVMVFRLPSAALATFYTLIISRENPRATLHSGLALLGAFVAGTVYLLIGVMVAIDYPITHFVWIVATLFLCFFVMRVITNYGAAAAFAFVIATTIPAWDLTGPIETHVYATLWSTYSVFIAISITIAVEYLFQSFNSEDELLSAIEDRLHSVELILLANSVCRPEPKVNVKRISQYATVGESRLRRMLTRSDLSSAYINQMNAVIALTTRLVDISANLDHIESSPVPEDCDRLEVAADQIRHIRDHLLKNTTLHPSEIPEVDRPSVGLPLLPEVERTIALMSFVLAGGDSMPHVPPLDTAATNRRRVPWVDDAFSNPDHIRFAIRGTLAATLAYITYNVLAWPGVSTCVATCIITALSNVGSSRQKQILRVLGAIIGGIVLGMGAQVLVLPGVDSITVFLLTFAVVTGFAAWIATGSARISYMGLQIALAFDLINVGDFSFQTSLTIARDRVIGVLLGLACMWIANDTFWRERASEQMLEIFADNLHLLAQLALIDAEGLNHRQTILKIRALRDEINNNFSAIVAQADAVHFETGADLPKQLAVRNRIIEWQSALRTIFLLQLAMLQYRLQTTRDEVSSSMLQAQGHFELSLSRLLSHSAFHIQGHTGEIDPDVLRIAYEQFEQAVHADYDAPERVPAFTQAILALAHKLRQVTSPLASGIQRSRLPFYARQSRSVENVAPTMQTR